MPARIQRRRSAGWRMPEGAVYVGRPSIWGNPFRGPGAVERYRSALLDDPTSGEMLETLRGADLVCWCPLDRPCHADVLLELANGE